MEISFYSAGIACTVYFFVSFITPRQVNLDKILLRGEYAVKDDEVIFSEVSPRPHDTGLVTIISQDLSEFALHARAILGLPIPNIHQHGPSASSVILVEGESTKTSFANLGEVLAQPNTQLRLFGKPEVKGQRRMGVVVARAGSVEEAREIAVKASSSIKVSL